MVGRFTPLRPAELIRKTAVRPAEERRPNRASLENPVELVPQNTVIARPERTPRSSPAHMPPARASLFLLRRRVLSRTPPPVLSPTSSRPADDGGRPPRLLAPSAGLPGSPARICSRARELLAEEEGLCLLAVAPLRRRLLSPVAAPLRRGSSPAAAPLAGGGAELEPNVPRDPIAFSFSGQGSLCKKFGPARLSSDCLTKQHLCSACVSTPDLPNVW